LDYKNSPSIHVGNLLYNQGIGIITNQNYKNILPYAPIANNNFIAFSSSYSPKTLNILANDISGPGTLLTASVVLSGADYASFTNNLDGTVTLNTTTPGVYNTYYTVNSDIGGGCYLTSNKALVTVKVLAECGFTAVLSSTPAPTSTPTTAPTIAPTTALLRLRLHQQLLRL